MTAHATITAMLPVLLCVVLWPLLITAQTCPECDTAPCFPCGPSGNTSCTSGVCTCSDPFNLNGTTCTRCAGNSSCASPEYCDTTPRVAAFKEFDCALTGASLVTSQTYLGATRVSYTMERDAATGNMTITEIGYTYGSPDTLYYKCVRTECSQLQYGQETVETRCQNCSCNCTSNCLSDISKNGINNLNGAATFTCSYQGTVKTCQLIQLSSPIPVNSECVMSECTTNATIQVVKPPPPRIANENAIIWAYFIGVGLLLTVGLAGFIGGLLNRLCCATASGMDQEMEVKKAVRVAWSHITYDVSFRRFMFTAKQTRHVINDVSGAAEPGQLLAIMGPSGAGKSTMLDVLFGLPMSGVLRGKVTANGEPVGPWFANDCGYVQQEDTLQATLTVREQLMYAAELRLPASRFSPMQKVNRVEKVIRDLRLTEVADSIIGGRMRRGLSGGEKKRVQIGMELLTQPAVLFVDEPTSGLDSHNAFLVMTALKDQAKAGRTVIVAIHQPRSSIYALFDRILLLYKGRVLFTGSTDSLRSWVERQLGQTIPVDVNAADFLFDFVLESKAEEADALVQKFKDTPEDRRTDSVSAASEGPGKDRDIEPLARPASSASRDRSPTLHQRLIHFADGEFVTSWIHQYYTLLKYQVINLVRNPVLLPAHVIFAIGAALYLGALYWNVDLQFVGFQNRCGAVFASLVLLAFTNMSVVDMIVSERAMFENERLKRYYRLSAYLLSRILVPVAILNVGTSLLFTLVNYWMTGYQNKASVFFWFLSGMTLSSLAAASLLIGISVLCKQLTVAVLVSTLLLLTMMLFSGFLVHTATIPAFIRWLQWTSFFRYAYEAMLGAELTGLIINAVPASLLKSTVAEFEGSVLITAIALRADRGPRDLAVLIGMAVGILLLTFLYLRISRIRR